MSLYRIFTLIFIITFLNCPQTAQCKKDIPAIGCPPGLLPLIIQRKERDSSPTSPNQTQESQILNVPNYDDKSTYNVQSTTASETTSPTSDKSWSPKNEPEYKKLSISPLIKKLFCLLPWTHKK